MSRPTHGGLPHVPCSVQLVTKTALALVLAALCLPVHALAADWAVGAQPGGMAALRAELSKATVLVPGRTLLVHGDRPHVSGASYVSNLSASRRSLAFANTEPDASQQWYLTADNAWAHWPVAPSLAPVKVAVIDSGIDASHPEFAGRVLGGISYVGGDWRTDTCGHGTFVAGEIAANPFNNVGIAGLAFNAELLVAKVVEPDCNVSTEGEVKAIRWAVDNGRSRDQPLDRRRRATRPTPTSTRTRRPRSRRSSTRTRRGCSSSRRSGTGPRSPKIAVALRRLPGCASARARRRGAPRERLRARLLEPRQAVRRHRGAGRPRSSRRSRGTWSTPRSAAAPGSRTRTAGPPSSRTGIGTSFAAPQVTAGAALLLGIDPRLKPSQLEWLLERSATDANPVDGLRRLPRRPRLAHRVRRPRHLGRDRTAR